MNENSDALTENNIISEEELKKFMNLDGIDIDVNILRVCIYAAESYINKRNEEKYSKENIPHEIRLSILMLATFYFQERDGSITQNKRTIFDGVDRLLDIARTKIST